MTLTSADTGLRRLSLDTVDSPAGVAWTLTPLTDPPAEWRAVGTAPVPATVPGEVYADLLAAGLIPDPFDADNEDRLHWIGSTDWSYETSFSFTRGAEQRHHLVFGGLDTLATVVLNGAEIGRTANQHRSHRFDVTEVLVEGANSLQVRFEGPVTGAQRLSGELGDRPRAYAHPFNAIRKMAAGYGWDWGPDLAGAGIWKSVGIESWSGVRLGAVRPLALVEGTAGRLETHVALEWTDEAREQVEVAVTLAGQTVTATADPGRTELVVEVTVPDVELWWPIGYGPQTRYDVTVEVAGQSYDAAVGFRTAELSITPDEHGTGFAIVVNGTPIYVRGVNWIPDDALLTRLTAETYRSSITDAVDAGANLLRIWVVASTRATTSTTSATSWGSWSGRTSCSPAPPTARTSRCAPRSKPRPGRPSRACRRGPAWCCGTATTRTSGAGSNGAGGSRWPAGAGATATTPRSCRAS